MTENSLLRPLDPEDIAIVVEKGDHQVSIQLHDLREPKSSQNRIPFTRAIATKEIEQTGLRPFISGWFALMTSVGLGQMSSEQIDRALHRTA